MYCQISSFILETKTKILILVLHSWFGFYVWVWERAKVCFLVHSDLCPKPRSISLTFCFRLSFTQLFGACFVGAVIEWLFISIVRFTDLSISSVFIFCKFNICCAQCCSRVCFFSSFLNFCGNRISYKFVCFDWITKAVFTVCLICFFLCSQVVHTGKFCSKVKNVSFFVCSKLVVFFFVFFVW